MKTQGERFRHVRENMLKMTRSELGAIIGASDGSIQNIESETGGKRTLRDAIDLLGISESWLKTGKGNVFSSGDEAENISRIKSLGGQQHTVLVNDPWKDEAYKLKDEIISRQNEEISRLRNWVDTLMQKVSFLKQPGEASYNEAAAA